MRVFASIAVLLTVTLGLHAQERNSLDIGIGPTFSAANIDEADGQKAFAGGTSFSFRYTRHIGERWGIFAQADVAGSRVFEKSFFNRLESIDDGAYTYGPFKTGKSAPYSSYPGAVSSACALAQVSALQSITGTDTAITGGMSSAAGLPLKQ